MKKILLFLVLSIFLVKVGFIGLTNYKNLVYASDSSSCDIYISSCSVLTYSDKIYCLNQSIIDSSSTICMSISANNVVLDCQGYTIDGVDDLNTYGIYIPRSFAQNTNITVKNCDITGWGYGIYLNNARNNTLTNNTANSNSYSGFYFVYSSNNTLTNNTANSNSYYGFLLYSSSNNTLTNNTANSNSYYGFVLYLSSSNTLTNNTANSNSYYGFLLYSSSNNSITGGSITSNTNYDYYLELAGSTNNFIQTNFIQERKIYFDDTTSWFNYNDRTDIELWLKTSVSGSAKITRKLISWKKSLMIWNDTNTGTDITTIYNITGLNPNKYYLVYNNSVLTYTLQTDSSGSLPSFTIYLLGEREIKVQEEEAPQYSLNSTNSTIAETAVSHNLYWQDDVSLSHAIFSFDNCTGKFQNISEMSLSGSQAWSNFTVVINSTVNCLIRWKVYANDSNNNWNSSLVYTFTTSSAVYCGNNVCDYGENCYNCPDCSCPDSPGCCGEQCGCPSGQVCENDVCVTPSLPPPPPIPQCPQDFVALSEEKNATLVVKCIDKNQTRNFIFSDFTLFNLTLKAKSTIYNFIIRIERIPGSLIDSGIKLNKKVYGYLEFSKENLDEKLLQEIISRFKVKKSWVFSENINTSTISFYRLTTSWEKLPTYKINEDSSFIYFESKLPGFSIFAIAGDEKVSLPVECPVCPSPSEWSECVNGKRNRTAYTCGEETNFTCLSYTQEEECEEQKEEIKAGFPIIYFVLIIISSFLIVFLVFYFRKTIRPKKEVGLTEKEVICPRCFTKMEKTYSGKNIEIYECKKCGYTRPEIKELFKIEK